MEAQTMTALLVTLVIYKLLLLGVGAWASSRSTSEIDFFLGGRRLGPWIASLSSAASSSSAWTLLGVSGAAFSWGWSAVWLLPACMFGFALNWFFVAERLRSQSARTGAVTLTEFICGKDRRLRALAAIIILLSLGVYVASQFKAAGVTFSEILGMGDVLAIGVGGGIVLLYTMTGGFWAVSVTDLIQGVVMVIAAVLVPIVALFEIGGFSEMMAGLSNHEELALRDPFGDRVGSAAVGFVLGTLGIGLGYPGQPHVSNRFMAMRNSEDVQKGTWISLIWAILIYTGMLIVGWCSRSLIQEVGNNEAVLLLLTQELFSPVLAGIIVAAVLSAIMSTADSQLLVCASTVSYDLAQSRNRSQDRVTILIIGEVAILAASFVEQTIFDSVLFAWSALGAAFGPLLLVQLWCGPVRSSYALASMASGFSLSLIWFFTPLLKGLIYELVPAFLLALLLAWLGFRQSGRGKKA
tara:strand:- start:2599 stop:3999 length:1401 start_codon:yes stop_codon:yes gene_type:complete